MGTTGSKSTTLSKADAAPSIGDEPVDCPTCHKPVNDSENVTQALSKFYHPDCFVCSVCKVSLANAAFCVDTQGQIMCESDFADTAAEKCESCALPLIEGKTVTTLGRTFHEECFTCSKCNVSLSGDQQFFADFASRLENGGEPPAKRQKEKENKGSSANASEDEEDEVVLFCKRCNFVPTAAEDAEAAQCAWCGEWVDGQGIAALGKRWHEECFVCDDCEEPLLETGQFFEVEGRVFCRDPQCVFMRKEREETRKRKLAGTTNVITSPLQRFRRKPAAARTIQLS